MGHSTQEKLNDRLTNAQRLVEINKVYPGDGDYRRVLALGFDEETETPAVVYQSAFARGLIFCDSVNNFRDANSYMRLADGPQWEELMTEAREQVIPGALYYHYKKSQDLYRLTYVGLQRDTLETFVAYQAIYGMGLLWIRQLNDFTEQVEGPDGQPTPRFTQKT